MCRRNEMRTALQLCFGVLLLAIRQQHLTEAQVPFPNQCPDVKIVTEFDLDAYMGIWYEYSKYPFVFEVGKKCMYAIYENIDNETVSVVNAAVNRFTGLSSNVTGTAKVIAPGQLAVTFSNNQNPNKANYLVLGTDYTSYVVVYSCTNFTPIAHTKIVWILTRERKPNNATIDSAKKILEDNNLPQTFLIDTLQDDCPAPATDSSKETTENAESGDDAAPTTTAATTETDTKTNGGVDLDLITTTLANLIEKA